ncbi:MAG: HEAT repeat domain-containing protein [Planctomycetota bacterium]
MNLNSNHSFQFKSLALFASAFVAIVSVIAGCMQQAHNPDGRSNVNLTISDPERAAHLDRVQRSDFCAGCHPDAAAEHRMNTHGRAFSDVEVRQATAQFSIPGCIDCHTPRPVFETGIGKNPIKRLHHLEEANSCLTCHARGNYDMSTFQGSARECKEAFDERVGLVEACASCHRNHGTPYQWEHAKFGKLAGNVCIDCHMPEVERAVAVGGTIKKTKRHTFFASRSESQLKMAYDYDVKLDGNELVVNVTNSGTGHNFPTELKQRSVESLVIVRNVSGIEIARSRQIFRDPYKRPYGLNLPVNTQIPSGESREHRVPVPIAAGTIETQLFYKLYYPIDDYHPDLSRVLESRSLAFGPIEPSTKPITTAAEIQAHLPEALAAHAASPGNLADFARPKIDKVNVDIPDGTKPGDVEQLISLFQFPVPEANKKAQDTLVMVGAAAVPGLIGALGSWDSKTWVQAQNVLIRIGTPAIPELVKSMNHAELYVRYHAREILARFDHAEVKKAGAVELLVSSLKSKEGLDRSSAADAIAKLKIREAIPALRELLKADDFDVVAAGARALGAFADRDSIEILQKTLARIKNTIETARDVAWSLAAAGSVDGARFLLDRLDYPDELVRVSIFEAFLDVTGLSAGYTPNLPFEERSTALAELRHEFVMKGAAALRAPRSLQIPGPLRVEVTKLVREMGGNDVHAPDAEETDKAIVRLIEIGKNAVPIIVEGLKWPAGFVDKRVALLRVLCEVPDPDALPALINAANDPTLTTSLWAARALETLNDKHGAHVLAKLTKRFDEAAGANRLSGNLGHPEDVRVMLGRVRAKLGDGDGGRLLLRLLFSIEPASRAGAEAALRELYVNNISNNSAIAKVARETLAKLPELRAAQVAEMRATWEKLVEKAEAAGDAAETKEQIMDALTKYDFAEEAATRYVDLDPRGFSVDFLRTTRGADALSVKLSENAAYRDAVAARDLHSILERRGWAQTANGMNVQFEEGRIVIDSSAGGSLTFGLGGPAGTSIPMEWWRDYELTFDVTIDQGELWILDRYDPIWAIYTQTAMSASAPEARGILHAQTQEKVLYQVKHSAIGSDIIHQQKKAGEAEEAAEVSISAPQKVRKGGMVFQVTAGTKVVISNLRLKVFRSDAAESVNAMIATPGR